MKEIDGFLIICLKCQYSYAYIEIFQNGINFKCKKCGNKMFLHSGEKFNLNMKKNIKEFRKKINPYNKKTKKEIMKEIIDDIADNLNNKDNLN